MKVTIILSVLLCSGQVFAKITSAKKSVQALKVATTCPDISGTWALTKQLVMKVEQNGCHELTKVLGTLASDGTVNYLKPQLFKLDGTALCNPQNVCESALASEHLIKFTQDYEGYVEIEPHGTCSHRAHTYAKDAAGNLIANFQVFNCLDGYSGTASKTFRKF